MNTATNNTTEMNPKNNFDKTTIFEQECRELLEQVTSFCKLNDIPFFWTAAVENTNKATNYLLDFSKEVDAFKNDQKIDTFYDKSSEFKKECSSILDELVLRCSIYRIPFFWTAAVINTEEGTEYESEAVGVASRKISLTDDRISKLLAVVAGFDVVPQREKMEIIINEEDEDGIVSAI